MSNPSVSPPGPSSDAEYMRLLRAIATGDQAAMATLYDLTSPLVHGLALRIVGDSDGAEEVTLEVYVQVWNQASRYDPQRGAPLAWLFTIARSRALDRRRLITQRQQREAPLVPEITQAPDTQSNPAEASLLGQQQALVQAALRSLAPEQREAIELAYYAGLSHSEIASYLRQPLGTIKTRVRLGMMHLRDRLASLLER